MSNQNFTNVYNTVVSAESVLPTIEAQFVFEEGPGTASIQSVNSEGGTGNNAIAIGNGAGAAADAGISIGLNAGRSMGTSTITIGPYAGQSGTGTNAVAVGSYAGNSGLASYMTAVGANAARLNPGVYSTALGTDAGRGNLPANSICLSAGADNHFNDMTGWNTAAFYAYPVREDATATQRLLYDPTRAEITRADVQPVVLTDPTGISGADAVTNIVSLTQVEYDAIGAPNASTLYVITT